MTSPPSGAGPTRTCVGCRTLAPAATLLRVVARDGAAVPDPQRRLPGRGAHLHRDPACLALAERRRALPRALRVPAPLDTAAVRTWLAELGMPDPLQSPTIPTTTTPGRTDMPDPASTDRHTITPYLAVSDAPAALRWYADVLGAWQLGEPWIEQDGRVGHCEIAIGDSTVMLSDEFPEIDVLGPGARGGTTVTLHLKVEDADDVVERAVLAGAGLERPVADQPYGRLGVVRDPWGHRWMINATRATEAPPGGDPQAADDVHPEPLDPASKIGYFVLNTPDDDRARAFFGAVLGWEFATGTVPRGYHVTNVAPMGGLAGGEEARFTLWFQVEDIDAAVRRVRELGGTALDPDQQPYGRVTTCTDDQGLPFGLLG